MRNENPGRSDSKGQASYWSRNVRRLLALLLVWFAGSYGTSILLVDELDSFTFFGVPLGFWFAQQGSIYVFLILILVYVVSMNRLDDEYEEAERRAPEGREVPMPVLKKGDDA